MDTCRRCGSAPADSPVPDLCTACVSTLDSPSVLCEVCQQRNGRVYPGLDEGHYCSGCVPARAEEMGVEMNPSALRALAFLTHLQEKLNEVQAVLQDRVCLLNEDVTGYVHQRSEYCLSLLQLETQRTQHRYTSLMSRLQHMTEQPSDDDEEAMEQVRVPGLLKSLSAMVLHRVNIQAAEVNRAMTRALMGEFVFFSELVEIVEFQQRQDGGEDDEQ